MNNKKIFLLSLMALGFFQEIEIIAGNGGAVVGGIVGGTLLGAAIAANRPREVYVQDRYTPVPTRYMSPREQDLNAYEHELIIREEDLNAREQHLNMQIQQFNRRSNVLAQREREFAKKLHDSELARRKAMQPIIAAKTKELPAPKMESVIPVKK